ncbi:MAG: amidase [Candidatus Tectimicrobiota bacterium]
MPSHDPCLLPVTTLASLVATRALSPVELVEAHLARIEHLNASLLAYLHVSAEPARAAARAAELEISSGGYRGPLHGIPVAYKDIFDVQGLPTTAGSKLMADYVATEDATAAARLRQAGAICLGKLNTIEFASGSMDVYGSARNPWNTTMFPGGSSAGSGTALAAHLIPLATGSDTGGSIRNPASFCGIVGLKPTYGRISRAGIVPLSWSLDHAGPMARTVADVALMLQAMAGPDQRDASAAQQAVPDYHAALRGTLRGLRLGIPRTFFFAHADPEVISAVHTAITLLQQLGVSLYDIDLPHACYGPSASWSIAYSEAFAWHRSNFFARARDYTTAFLHKITAAACLTAEERVTAQRLRQVITAEFLAALDTVDAIVTPTTSYAAHPIGQPSPQPDMRSLTRPVSLTGLPALALPCGFTSTGLPISMQLVGRSWDEPTVLRLGHAYEQAAGWSTRQAPLSATEVTPPTPPPTPPGGTVDAQWVLDFARLTGLTFVTEADAVPVAAALSPVKTQLAEARARLAASCEPPVRPAPL